MVLQGIKTVVTVNDPVLVTKHAADAAASSEIWLDYADDSPPLRAKHPGDPRAAFTPWLAHAVPNTDPIFSRIHPMCPLDSAYPSFLIPIPICIPIPPQYNPSHPIMTYPTPCFLIACHPTRPIPSSHPIPSHPIRLTPSHPISAHPISRALCAPTVLAIQTSLNPQRTS